MKLNIFIKSLFYFSIFFLFILIWNYWIFQIDFIYDSLIYISAIPDSTSFEYWLNVFTTPNAWIIRYRPMGFFTYFYFVKNICGMNSTCAHSISILLLFFSSVFMFFVMRLRSEKNVLSAFIFTLLWILFFGLVHPVWNISNAGKYLIPLLCLVLGLFLIEKNIKKYQPVFLTLLSLFSIFGNESHLSIGGVFLLYLGARSQLTPISAIMVSFPTCVYLLLRIFVWGLPGTWSEVEIHWTSAISAFPPVFLGLFLPPTRYMDLSFFWTILFFFLFFIVYILLFLYQQKSTKYIIACLTSCIFLILPYTFIPKHMNEVLLKVYCLSSVPLYLLFFEVYKISGAYSFFTDKPLVKKLKSDFIKHFMFVLYFVFQISYSHSDIKKIDIYLQTQHLPKYKQFLGKMQNFIKEKMDSETYVLSLKDQNVTHYNCLISAGILAKHFSNLNFMISGCRGDNIIVTEGFIFYERNGTFIDLFNQPVDKGFSPHKKEIIVLNSENINFYLKGK